MYQNPPHYNLEKLQAGGRAPLSADEIRRLTDEMRDRFDFRNADGKLRSISVESKVDGLFVTNSGRLCALLIFDRYPNRCAKKQTLVLGETPENLALKPAMDGCFNGEWSAWNGAGTREQLVLDQRMDYAGSVPVRAAVWDIAEKKWEFLWDTESPQMPPPPPGVMNDALA